MQIQKASIRVGSRFVGEVWVDGGTVRGEGGPARPQLVVPLTVTMQNAPEESMVAVLSVRASLSTSDNQSPHTLISSRVTEMLIDNMPIRSLPSGSRDLQVWLRFVLTDDEVERLELRRHADAEEMFTLFMSVEAVVAAVVATHNQVRAGETPTATPWDYNFGMFSELQPFWNTQVDTVRIAIEQSRWVRDVLPGLGYDRRRLLELVFPPPLPDHKSAAREWDKARKAYDTKRYGDCVAECRDLLSMWRTQFGATAKNPIANVIADRNQWTATDNRRRFLADLWKSATDVANVEHHPEGTPDEQYFDAADARLILLLTAALSEYLGAS